MSNALTRTFRGLLANLTGKHFGGDRDLFEQFGYPNFIEPDRYVEQYRRGDIGGRIIDAYPQATWREEPMIVGDDGGQLEEEIETLNERFHLWATLERLDRLMGMGHYGVLLIGLSGGESMARPVSGNKFDLIYLQPYGESAAEIQEWNADPRSSRYGKPKRYRIRSGVEWAGIGGGQRYIDAHWTRTIHVAERALDDESIGVPRLERIFNRLMDLEKLLGGSAETYWQNAAMLRAWVADADTEWDPEEKDEIQKQMEQLMHGLRRDLRLRGVTPHSLAEDPADPSGHVEAQLDIIAGASGIPKRILIGSERGELSSEQDENNWNGRIAERRTSFITPRIIRPLIDRFIELGIIRYRGKYTVEWPESDSLGEEARSTIALNRAQAVQAYASVPAAELYVRPEEFRQWVGEEPESEFAPAPETDDEIDETDPQTVTTFRRLKANARPRPLYVRRDVVNADAIRAHFLREGLRTAVPARDMHVTIAYCETPVDWMRVGEAFCDRLEIPAGGPRIFEPLGPKGAVVLHFASSELSWRHEQIKEAGASYKWPTYQPHITITYDLGGIDADSVEPFRGEIILGPEIFEEPDDGYSDRVVENA